MDNTYNDDSAGKTNLHKKIYDDFTHLNQKMAEELQMSSQHPGLTGSAREEMWLRLFRQLLPKKFTLVRNVLIIDSYGNVSREVDIAAIDEQYTPYIFQYNELKFIPIEAVAVVVECKSKSIDSEKVTTWFDAIDQLKTNPSGIARMQSGFAVGSVSTQKWTRPIRILANINDGKHDDLYEKFDFVIRQSKDTGGNQRLDVISCHEDKALTWWCKELNGNTASFDLSKLKYPDDKKVVEELGDTFCAKSHSSESTSEEAFKNKLNVKLKTVTLKELRIGGKEEDHIDFLTFNLQLNQLLMILNNPPLFPHYAYAKLFREKLAQDGETK
jgi:hypothetical protein